MVLMAKERAIKVAAKNNADEDNVLDGAWTYEAKPAGPMLTDSMPLSAGRLWVVEVYDETGDYMGTL